MSYQSDHIVDIDISRLHPHPANPRHDLGDTTELAASIRTNGLLSLISVVPDPDHEGDYRIIAGHRRHKASIDAGLDSLPCMILTLDEREQREAMLTENTQREQLTVIEEAQAIQGLLDLGATQADTAAKLGRSTTWVGQRAKIAKNLPADAQAHLDTVQPTLDQCMTIAGYADLPDLQARLIDALATGENEYRSMLSTAKWERKRVEKITAVKNKLAEQHIPFSEQEGMSPAPDGRHTVAQIYFESTPIDKILEDIDFNASHHADLTACLHGCWLDFYEPESPDRRDREAEQEAERERERKQRRALFDAWKRFYKRAQSLRLDWWHAHLHQLSDKRKALILAHQVIDLEHQVYYYEGIDEDTQRIIEHITGLPFDQPIDAELDDETRLTILEARAEDDPLTWAAALAIANLEKLLGQFTTEYDGMQRLRGYYKLLESFGYETTRDEQLALYGNYDPLKTEGQQS